MLVYRLETQEGKGCYGRGYAWNCTRAFLSGDTSCLHPAPSEDAPLQSWWDGKKLSRFKKREWIVRGREKWHCAFESLDKLEAWFPVEGLTKMIGLGQKHGEDIVLSIYKVPHHKVRKGEFQAMYHADHAELVEQISLEELIKRL